MFLEAYISARWFNYFQSFIDNDGADELIEAKVTKNTQIGFEGNLLLDSSGDSYVSEKTCILAGTEDEHFGFDSEVDFRNTCEKSGHKSLENEATDPLATASGKFLFYI